MRKKEVTAKIMSSIGSQNTKPEILLGSAMWRLGLRYRKHYKVIGKPDFAFVTKKVAVFCDGDFWHGNNWKIRGLESLDEELNSYNEFWREKIKRNIKRDKLVTKSLMESGWEVLRFWESDIKSDPLELAYKVKLALKEKIIS